MQGRLSPVVDGRIQAFPWSTWREEFPRAQIHGFHLMEWTLDQDRLFDSPLLTPEGQDSIRLLCDQYRVKIPSLTGDCFMQAPFWKASGAERERLQNNFHAIAAGCVTVGISIIVVPLVDNGQLDDAEQRDILISFLRQESAFLKEHGLKVAFESDYAPADLARFIRRLDTELFGINYDIGNSASLGFDPAEEFSAYGHRILNVHIKDRVLRGTTVPLGAGNADFNAVFGALGRLRYTGNYILQTARATDGDHSGALTRYRDMAAGWIQTHGA